MKVLFLDIDGVCNSEAYARQLYAERGHGGMIYIDPAAAAKVQRVIKETGCKVVLSSSWRYDKHLVEIIEKDVCTIIDCTKRLSDIRGKEVQEWLDRHPEVSCYAILDDDSDFLPHQWLFKTTWEKGITEEITQALIHHLNASALCLR